MCGHDSANSPRVRTPAHSGGRHRLPRAREPLYPEPQDCSDFGAAGHCAQRPPRPLPGRFRRLPAERPACAPRSTREFDASRPDIANYRGPLSPRPAGRPSRSRDSTGALRTESRVLNSTPVQSGSLGSCRARSVKPLDNLRSIAEDRLCTRARRAPMTRSGLCVRVAANSSLSIAHGSSAETGHNIALAGRFAC